MITARVRRHDYLAGMFCSSCMAWPGKQAESYVLATAVNVVDAEQMHCLSHTGCIQIRTCICLIRRPIGPAQHSLQPVAMASLLRRQPHPLAADGRDAGPGVGKARFADTPIMMRRTHTHPHIYTLLDDSLPPRRRQLVIGREGHL